MSSKFITSLNMNGKKDERDLYFPEGRKAKVVKLSKVAIVAKVAKVAKVTKVTKVAKLSSKPKEAQEAKLLKDQNYPKWPMYSQRGPNCQNNEKA